MERESNTRERILDVPLLEQLVRVFNATLGRLEEAFEQLRRFTSDASHELRTLLAMIRSVGEVGLQKDGTRADYRDIIGSMLEEVNRLTSLVENLLTISRADSGHIQLQRSVVPVMALAREAVGLFGAGNLGQIMSGAGNCRLRGARWAFDAYCSRLPWRSRRPACRLSG